MRSEKLPAMSMAELRALAQPPAVMGRRNSEHWAGSLYLRRMSIYVTRFLLPTGISANGVTWLMIGCGPIGAAFLLLSGWWPVFVCAVLMQFQILLDCSDGEVARVRRTTSPRGVYLDRVGHYLTEACLPVGFGIHVDGGLGSFGGWTTLGALTAVVVMWNKNIGDLIHIARGYARLPLLSEDASIAAVRATGLARVRRQLKVLPFYRAFVAIEFSLICLAVASVDALAGGHGVSRAWVIVAGPLALFTAAGHLAAVLMSRRLTD